MTDETYEITLEKFIYGGEAMGRLPASEGGKFGRAVFVPFALPGERVRIRLTFQKRGFARARLLEVLEDSPERIPPKCPHFGGCGHCAYQHIPYESQLRAKEEILRDQLIRIGKVKNPPVNEIIPSPEIWHYRNQMDFQLTDRRKQGISFPNILSITECHLPEPTVNDFWTELEFGENDLFETISLRQDAANNLMLIIHSDNPETPEMTLETDLSVVHLTAGDAIVMGGDDHLVITLHNRPLRVSAASFSHPNTRVAEKMITHLLNTLPLTSDSTLLELFSGIGSFSAFLAPKVGRLVCIEESPAACEDFGINLDEFENVELYQAQAKDALPSLDFTPDIILADPPEGGLGRHTLDGILHLGAATLAYVSRDPSTLARDAARLIKGGYRLEEVTPFDVAPQTAQIDSISIFKKG
ncbi:MAG: class I SAM-dependent RNA methyltransferase [Anaerolineae bacterium]|nr:class I SAM-dependent RNA methyltransferase [Anaerolineae bacterium]